MVFVKGNNVQGFFHIFQENSQLSQQFCKLIQRVHGKSKKAGMAK
jgi:hypothetical protein